MLKLAKVRIFYECLTFSLHCFISLRSWEIYWDEPKGSYTDLNLSPDATEIKDQILFNFITAAKRAQIQHMVVVTEKDSSSSVLLSQLELSGIPFTCIVTPKLTDRSSCGFSFQDGLCDDLIITSIDNLSSDSSNSGSIGSAVCREDVAALCVQVLQSLQWNKRRYLEVTSNGPVKVPSLPNGRPKRVDQQWCIDSFILEEKLNNIV
jgi:hypothetical protein